MATGRPTRRELLTGMVLVAGGAAVVRASQVEQAEAAASAAEAAGSAQLADGAAGRLGVHRVIWSVPNQAGLVGLTFDDGPTTRYTPRVLEALRAAGATATFNVVGVHALEQPSLLREIVAAGHQLGNHTHHHRDLGAVAAPVVAAEIGAAQDAIEQCVQVPVTVFRPPRGELTGVAAYEAAARGMDVLMWSITRGVPGIGTSSAVLTSLATRVVAGDVVCLHDGLGHAGFTPGSAEARMLQRRRDVEMKALPHVLRRLADRGLRCVSVRDLLAVTGQ